MENEVVAIALSERDRRFALQAAEWATNAHQGVAVTAADAAIEIGSSRPQGELRRIWNAALLNERLVAEASAERAAVLGQLVK
nr:hypothetical protein [Sphingomonas sp. CDS-1]